MVGNFAYILKTKTKKKKIHEVSYTLCRLISWGCFSFEEGVRNGFERGRVVLQDGEEGAVPSVSGVGSFESQHQRVKAAKVESNHDGLRKDRRKERKGRLNVSQMSLSVLTCPERTDQQHLCYCSTLSSHHLTSGSTPVEEEQRKCLFITNE